MMSHAPARIAPSFGRASIDALCQDGYRCREVGLAHAPNILLAGYEFESGKAAIS
jgi:hypothetical protein